MKILREHIVVKVPSIFIDETKYKGVDGKNIIINVLFNPERHVRNYGIVVSVPDELYYYPLFNEHIGRPAYSPHTDVNSWWKTTADIELDIREGDKVYFHPNCLLPDQQGDTIYNKMFLCTKKEIVDGKETVMYYFRIKYELVFAAVRYVPANNLTREFEWSMEKELTPFTSKGLFVYHGDKFDHIYRKEIVMIGSYVLVEPDFETWEDISIPVPEVINGKKILNPDGSVRMKPKEQWLVKKKAPDEHYLKGWVRHVGSPLKGDQPFLSSGMYVYFQKYANTKIKIEGYDYFRIRQRHIIGHAPFNNQYNNGTVKSA